MKAKYLPINLPFSHFTTTAQKEWDELWDQIYRNKNKLSIGAKYLANNETDKIQTDTQKIY